MKPQQRADQHYVSQVPNSYGKPPPGLRRRMFDVIFEADTPAGRRFDIALVFAIMLSILVVVLDSVPGLHSEYGKTLNLVEWGFTVLFSIEYLARVICVQRPWRYATGFYGVIDLLAVLPTYFSLLVPGSNLFLDIRILRLLRVFRIFKLTLYIEEYTRLGEALSASRRKIMVFLSVVLMAILILGTVMYVVEGPQNGYTSIPVAMYWATVTMTTVGYGDITPHTHLGKAIASFMMLMGWGILAVPTGIVTAELSARRADRRHGAARILAARDCPSCGSSGHEASSRFCKDCGAAF
ncbi:Cyclic nucleotide-gated potassium channel mll3241 [Massilia sp. Bi118]|uniref:ion transporter n=1 Tax=Massilia sp. Bi118 TaxID=2822346 RepID=UPI001DDE844F|nr:Cyclic nucleotide-gated potassium channel mll3241 [Massilia sp. Bi118]